VCDLGGSGYHVGDGENKSVRNPGGITSGT